MNALACRCFAPHTAEPGVAARPHRLNRPSRNPAGPACIPKQGDNLRQTGYGSCPPSEPEEHPAWARPASAPSCCSRLAHTQATAAAALPALCMHAAARDGGRHRGANTRPGTLDQLACLLAAAPAFAPCPIAAAPSHPPACSRHVGCAGVTRNTPRSGLRDNLKSLLRRALYQFATILHVP